MDPSTTERALHDLAERLATLERRDERLAALERENQQLRAEMAALRRSTASPTISPNLQPAQSTAIERVSRRWMLRRAAQITAATAAAGVLVRHQSQGTDASHAIQNVHANSVVAHQINADNESGNISIIARNENAQGPTIFAENQRSGPGVVGESALGTGIKGIGPTGVYGQGEGDAGVSGSNVGEGPGVSGYNAGGTGVRGTGLVGVYGTSSADGYGAVGGLHTGIGYGVVGDVEAAGVSGVLGRNSLGEGVRGEGATGVAGQGATGVYGVGGTGVHGVSAGTGSSAVFGEAIGAAIGVRGTSELSYGGLFKGSRAQVRLLPTGRIGKPTTGPHSIGELYLDKVGSLFICTAAGVPGTWRKVTTALA